MTTGPLYLPTPSERPVAAGTSSLALIEKEAKGRDPPSRRGPGWRMAHPLIGEPPGLVAVPTHFYKVILAEREGADALVAAFVLPNAAIDASTPLRSFLVPIESLESAAGCRFHEGVLAPGATARINERALRIRERAAGVNGPPMLAGGGLRPQRAAAGADGAAAEALPGGKDSAPGTGLGHLCDAVACELGAQWNWTRNGAATPTPLPAHSRPSKSSPAAPQA